MTDSTATKGAAPDRELLELAAKAAGIMLLDWRESWADHKGPAWRTVERELWNPLQDDGDALRLAVKRRMHVNIFEAEDNDGIKTPGFVEVWAGTRDDFDLVHTEYVQGDDYEAATRRAIVRAAAAIGKAID